MRIPYKNAMHPAFVPHNSRNRFINHALAVSRIAGNTRIQSLLSPITDNK